MCRRYVLVELVLLFVYFGNSGVAQYQWACTEPDEAGLRYVPNVRDYDLSQTAVTAEDELNVYLLPHNLSEACYGRIVEIEYCYQYDTTMSGPAVFKWTVLISKQQLSSQNYRITDRIVIESHSNSANCTKAGMCCDVTGVNRNLNLSRYMYFVFGVIGPSQGNTHNATLLGFHESASPQYVVDTVRQSVSGQNVSTLPSTPVDQRGLRMLWFVIDETTCGSSWNNVDSAMSDIDCEETTGSNGAITTDSEYSSTGEEVTDYTSDKDVSSMKSPDSMNITSQAVGGVLGGLLALAVIISVIVIIIVWVIIVRRRRSKQGAENCSDDGLGYHNAVYDATGIINGDDPITNQSVRFDTSTASEPHYEYAMSEHLGHDYSLLDDSQDLLETDSETAYETPVVTLSQNYVEDEDIYMAPATDEYSLYSQLSQIKIHTFTRDAIVLTALLGSGQFGTVHRGEWLQASGSSEEKSDVAVKTLKEGAGELDKVKFLQEAAIMGQFSHPNVVELYGVITQGEPIMLVIELLSKGDLRSMLCDIRTNPDSELRIDADLPHTLLSYCRQIASGMSYLAAKAFVHRDLAARNILVSEDGVCKIADFGMSRDLADTDYYVSHGGIIPVKWTSPEALLYKKYSTASDVWSFGCVMYEIWSLGHKPFEIIQNQDYIVIVDKGIRLAPPPGCSRTIYKLMVDCWHPNSSDRPNFVSVVQQLSLPDTKLLKWSDEDKGTADAEAAILGAGLDKSVDLYKDLQERYSKS